MGCGVGGVECGVGDVECWVEGGVWSVERGEARDGTSPSPKEAQISSTPSIPSVNILETYLKIKKMSF